MPCGLSARFLIELITVAGSEEKSDESPPT